MEPGARALGPLHPQRSAGPVTAVAAAALTVLPRLPHGTWLLWSGCGLTHGRVDPGPGEGGRATWRWALGWGRRCSRALLRFLLTGQATAEGMGAQRGLACRDRVRGRLLLLPLSLRLLGQAGHLSYLSVVSCLLSEAGWEGG